MPVVEVQDLSVRYGSVEAVSDVSFVVEAGQTVALIGANGAGKTSTVRALCGVIATSTGSVSVLGQDPARYRASIANRWGVMPQSGGLPMGLRVGECVELFAALHGNESLVAATLADCDLSAVAGRRWRTLSGGQQQRLSLAVALVGGRELLMLDEPTAALDVPGQERVLSVISDRATEGSAVLLTTHRLDEVERVADRVVILHEGHLVADSDVAALTDSVPEIRLRGLEPAQASNLQAATGVAFMIDIDTSWVGTLPPTVDPQAKLSEVLDWCAGAQVRITSASVGRRSLADAYREMVAKQAVPE